MKAPDLTQIWCDLFREAHQKNYPLKLSDSGIIRNLSDMYGNYELLLCMEKGIANGDSNITYLASNMERYFSGSEYVKYYYLIEKYGTKDMKELLMELSVLESRLLPTASSQNRIDEIIEEFDKILDNKKIE